jgi:hypothetical protein
MRTLIVAAALVVSMGAYAQQPTGPYFGALLGSADTSIEVDEDYTYNTDLFTWGAMAGWQINQHFAVEAGYLKPNTIRESFGEDTVTGKLTAWTASVLLSMPVSDRWSVYARFGGIVGKEKYSAVIDGLSYAYSDDNAEILYGVGVGVILEGAKVRLDYQRAEFDAGKVGVLSLGINWFIPTG